MTASEKFRECVAFVFQQLAMPEPPAEYMRDLEQLNAACVDWFKERAGDFGFLQVNMPDLFSGPAVITGPLGAAAVHWAGNDAARDFFEYIDRKTFRRCSLLQFQVLRALQQATGDAEVNSEGGSA